MKHSADGEEHGAQVANLSCLEKFEGFGEHFLNVLIHNNGIGTTNSYLTLLLLLSN